MRSSNPKKNRQPKKRYYRDRAPRRDQAPPDPSPKGTLSRLHREAKRLLANLGKPEAVPFVPDAFQVQAVEQVGLTDVVVTAPTGSGKTWIALQATEQFLNRGGRVWYATPLKALSNAKFIEFCEQLGDEQVGILTGDRKENADARIIVGTTEILRNQLYDSMQSGEDMDVDLVILDEAHYLGDKDRGVVWEEVLIYLPSRVRLLLLSATISNADEIARWLVEIRETHCEVVESRDRPVPLHVLFRTPDGQVTPFLRGDSLFPTVKEHAQRRKSRRKFRAAQAPDLNDVMNTMREFDLLPAIVFLKSRADCDAAIDRMEPSPRALASDDFRADVERFLQENAELRTQRQLEHLIESRAGSHHAGQLPAWRLLIEKLMSMGHLDVIFSTSTVAAGVNFPARTVVLVQSDRFNGESFVDMTATDFHQMTGRAGRRGMDKAGYTLVLPGKYMDMEVIHRAMLSPPEPLRSRISVNVSMTLNVLLSHDPAGARELLGLSFAGFHPHPARAAKVHRRLLKEFQRHMVLLQELGYLDDSGAPTYDGSWAAHLRLDRPLQIAELIREGVLDDLEPDELAALVAPFVTDREKEIALSSALWNISRPVWKQFRRVMKKLKPLNHFLGSRGFDVPPTMFWPAAATLMWAGDVEWDELTVHVDADEGDLAMLLLRTADHLRQLISLEGEKPRLAQTARAALPRLLRPPLV